MNRSNGNTHGEFPGTPTPTNQYGLGAAQGPGSHGPWANGLLQPAPHMASFPTSPAQHGTFAIDPSLVPPSRDASPQESLAERIALREGKQREKEDCYVAFSRGYSRWHEAVTSYATIISKGSKMDPEQRPLQRKEKIIFEKWRRLIEAFPQIEDEVAQHSHTRAMLIARSLDCGRSLARSDDNLNVKVAIGDLYDFGGILPSKSKRGFYHVVCAKLIGPYGVDMEDPLIRELYKNKKKFIVSGDLSLFLFEDETVDPHSIFKGWLRGIILLKVGVLIAYGKATARSDDPYERRAKGLAFKHGQLEVTIEFIAYCAVLAHFALSSTRTLNIDVIGPFSYAEYYETIITLFNKRSQSWCDDLLTFWNNYIYGERGYTVEEAIEEGNDRFNANTLAAIMSNVPEGQE